mgnify:CR=1 FL=1
MTEPFGARWSSWDDAGIEDLTVRWDNGGWTAEGEVGGVDVHYVIRMSEFWEVRQFLLFRDMQEPDLWLARDRFGRWGEVNGAIRADLAGCEDLSLACTPFTHTIPLRRLGLAIGADVAVTAAHVDVETLGVVPVRRHYTRLGEHRWRVESDGATEEWDTDERWVAHDLPGRFRRLG